MKLKKQDIKLIYCLDCNYMRPYSKVGKMVRMSQQLVSYKVNSFLKKDIIKKYLPVIDYSRLGFQAFTVFLKVKYPTKESFNRVVSNISQNEDVLAVEECDGKFDLVVTFAAKNPYSFNKKLKKMIFEISEIREGMILTNVASHDYLRHYLVGNEGITEYVIGEDKEKIDLDETSSKIINELADGKKKLVKMSEHLGISTKTVLSKIKRLEKEGLIKRYSLLLDHKLIGNLINVIIIRYNDSAFEQEDKFSYFCKKNPNIINFTKVFGEWDAVIHVETKNLSEFRKIFLEIRETFDAIIENIDTFQIHGIYKKTYLPRSFLSS